MSSKLAPSKIMEVMQEMFEAEGIDMKEVLSMSLVDQVGLVFRLPQVQDLYTSDEQALKSASRSDELREEGNKEFQAGKLKRAATCFTTALVHAPTNAEGQGREAALALANRSLCLLKLGEGEGALQDVQMAINAGYPQENRQKLEKRRAQCIAFCQQELSSNSKSTSSSSSPLPPSSPLSPKRCSSVNLGKRASQAPAFSDAVLLHHHPEKGRHGVATRFIPAGTPLLSENPVAARLKPQFTLTHCDHCMRRLGPSQLPCTACTAIRYCSLQCRIEGDPGHKVECGLPQFFVKFINKNNLDPSPIMHHLLLLRLLSLQPVDYYLEHCEQLLVPQPLAGTEGGSTVIPGELGSVAKLVSHEERMVDEVTLPFVLSTAFLIRALNKNGKEEGTRYWGTEEKVLAKLALRLHMVMKFNTHAITEAVLESRDRPALLDLRSIGMGLFPSLCMVNASCDQNISHYNDGTQVVAVAARDIREGEEVCDNYFPSSLVMNREERRAWLESHYWYHCQCCACQVDTPVLAKMSKLAKPQTGKCPREVEEAERKVEEAMTKLAIAPVFEPEQVLHDAQTLLRELSSVAERPYQRLCQVEHFFAKCLRQCRGNRVFKSR